MKFVSAVYLLNCGVFVCVSGYNYVKVFVCVDCFIFYLIGELGAYVFVNRFSAVVFFCGFFIIRPLHRIVI